MISIIAAVSNKNVIGNKGEIPWNLSRDMKHFATITKGHKVVMGKNTYESIVKKLGHPLPQRENFVLAKEDFDAPECKILKSIEEIFELAKNEEIFIIGGAMVYKQMVPFADKIYLTLVDIDCEGDTFFPEFNKNDYRLTSSEHVLKDEKNIYDCTFNLYEK